MRLRFTIAIALALLLAAAAAAQTTTTRLAWDQPLAGAQTFADVQAFVTTLKVDAGAAAIVTKTCTNGTPITCTVPLPALPSGPHTLTLTVSNGFGSASASLNGAPPATPVNVTVIVSVTVP